MADYANGVPPPISDGTPSPQSLEEFEDLIKRFYQPGHLLLVSSIEKHLQWHQRSPHGWDMATELLKSQDVNVRFFGALTLAVKLNTAGKDLDEGQASLLSQRLVNLYVERHNDAPMVAQKVASDLAIFFMQPNASASNCISLIARALANDGTPSEDASLPEVLTRLPDDKIFGVLKFVNTFAEEGNKRLSDAASDRKLAAAYEERIETNLQNASEVMNFCLDAEKRGNDRIRLQSVNCLATWAFFCQKATSVKLDSLTHLRSLIRPALRYAAEYSEEAALDLQPPFDIIAELLSTYSAFFKLEHLSDVMELLRSPIAQKSIASLRTGDEEAMPFARLLCAYVDADLARIVEALDDPGMQYIMSMMHELLHCEGYAAVDDNVIIEMQGIWNTVVEFIVDTSFDPNTTNVPAWHAPAKSHIADMVQEFLAKMQYPPLPIHRDWADDERKLFQQFRVDTRDLINTCHLALGIQLLQHLVDTAISALTQQNWTQLEAALFSLSGIVESLDDSAAEEAILAQLMNSSLYPTLTTTDSSIPLHVRRTAMRLIGCLGPYFERRTESLPTALNYLFTSLAAASMADAASKSIHNLCTACRGSLQPQLEDFFNSYQNFLSWPTASTFTKSKVIGAVAAIAQTLPTDLEKASALTRLQDFVEEDVKAMLQYMANGLREDSVTLGVCAMRCLSLIAKSYQETIEIVELDASPQLRTYWTTGDGSPVQQRIIRLLATVLDIVGSEFEVIEAVCDTLKAGFKETSPGPFVLRPSVVVEILTRPQANTQHLCLTLGTACGLLRAHTPSSSQAIDEEATNLLSYITTLISQLGDSRTDPEVAQAVVEVLTRYMPRYLSILLQSGPSLALILTFTIACIAAPEPLPKRSAATFWVMFLSLTSQPQPLQGLLDEVVIHFGPTLAQVFVGQIAGDGMRSDIEALADPVKKLWGRHPRARSWFEAALNEQPFAAISPQIKFRFLEQVRIAKELAAVRKAMREFGTACKAGGRVEGS